MKIKFLGTAAYEGVPALFCNCDVCKKSRALGGKNLRSRSQALINDEILIDFNADTVWHYMKYGFDWEKIAACLITHSHYDHLYPDDMEIAAAGYSHEHRAINFYSAKSGYDKIKAIEQKIGGGITATLVEIGKRFGVADGKYTVLPLRADHDPASSPVIYSITCGNKRMLYAHDTGLFPESTWELLQREGRFDLVSLDCTGCLARGNDWVEGHMSLGSDMTIFARMSGMGLIDKNTVKAINHFSHNGGQTYDEMKAAAEPLGITVAYDGLELEF